MSDETYGWIRLSGLRVDGARVGVFPHERHAPRPIVVDVALWSETAISGNTETLADTIDYDRLAGLVHDVCRARHYNLLETLAEKLATAVLERFPAARTRIEVWKPEATHGATASVAIERGRPR